MNKGSPLMSAIERATSETLLRPDQSFSSSVKDLISSRPDMPKEAIQILKKRVVARNPKVQILTLELLEYLVTNLPLPFHTQVASRDFLGTLSQVYRSRDVENEVKARLKDLIISWYRRFADSKDILPGFSDIYIQLKLGSEPERLEPKQQVSQMPGKKLPDGKAEKLKKDLQVVRDNINLTNDMIEAREDPRNETFLELVNTLKAMEGKILKLVERLEDTEVLDYCLMVKDHLQDTLKRYESFRSGNYEMARPAQNKDSGLADLLFDSAPAKPVSSNLDQFDSLFVPNAPVVSSSPNPMSQDLIFSNPPNPPSLGSYYQPENNLSGQLIGLDFGQPFQSSFPAGVNQPSFGNPVNFTSPVNPISQTGSINNMYPVSQSMLASPPVESKININYKATHSFDDPFSTGINSNIKPKVSPKRKDQNFDELFDFKF